MPSITTMRALDAQPTRFVVTAGHELVIEDEELTGAFWLDVRVREMNGRWMA